MLITDAVGRRLALPGQFVDPVIVESAEDLGPVFALRVRTLRGEPKEAMIARDDLIQALAHDAPTSAAFAPSVEHALLVESHQIRLAYAFDLLWLLDHEPAQIPRFLDESRVEASRLRLLANALKGRSLSGAEGDSRNDEQKAIDRLLAQWRRLVGQRLPIFGG